MHCQAMSLPVNRLLRHRHSLQVAYQHCDLRRPCSRAQYICRRVGIWVNVYRMSMAFNCVDPWEQVPPPLLLAVAACCCCAAAMCESVHNWTKAT